jgi:hypothetical protein
VEDIMSTTKESGTSYYIDDKWAERLEKGQKLADYAGRELDISDDVAAPKSAGYIVGKYESMPDGSWKGSGTCTYIDEGGDKLYESWEEDSTKGTYKNTGGTGKYKGASGGGTYTLNAKGFTGPMSGGTYSGKIELP